MYNVKIQNKKCQMNNSNHKKSPEMKAHIALCVLVFFAVISLSWTSNTSAAKLKTSVPKLCYNCHKDLKQGLSDRHVHFLFKEGKCTTCHNSHVSKIKGLMNNKVDALCLGCHDELRKLINKGSKHSALRDNDCTGCHFPHSGENNHLLINKEKDLCLKCHADLSLKFNEPHACAPFKQGNCSACHDSHASVESNLLLAPPTKQCKECHWPKCKAKDISIASVVADSDCTSCHSGHSSPDKGLLGPFGHKSFLEKRCEECHNKIEAKKPITIKIEGAELCFNCHKRTMAKYQYVDNDIHVKNAKNPCIFCHDHHASDNKNMTMSETRLCMNCHEGTEKRTSSMERVLKAAICEPIKERKCFECHIPTHSDRPLNFRAEEIPLCARCHASQHKITHPLGDETIDPRNGRAVTCVSCHSMHSSKDEFMLTHDRKRALCIQCHKM